MRRTYIARLTLTLLFFINFAPVASALPTITTLDSTGDVGWNSSMAIGADGNPIIAYFDETNDNLKVVHCGNASCTSGNVVSTIDSSGDVGRHPSISIGSNDRAFISYYDLTNTALKGAYCSNTDCSSSLTTTFTSDSTFASDVTTGADGFPVVSFMSDLAGDIDWYIIDCGNSTCSSGNTNTKILDAIGAGETSIAIGNDGFPVATAYDGDGGNGDLWFVKCTNATCSSFNSPISISSGGSFTPTIAIGGDGFPVVAYFESVGEALNLWHCGNASCTSGNAGNTVDTGGYFLGMAIAEDGYPIISYYYNSSTLKVAHCANAVCSSNTEYEVDTNAAGASSDIVVHDNGLPVVSYYGNTDLKVAACDNADCDGDGPDPVPFIPWWAAAPLMLAAAAMLYKKGFFGEAEGY